MESLHLLPRANPNQGCTVSTCDPSQSVYGYRPNLAATLVFLILFTLSGLIYTWQGILTKTNFFTTAMVLGCLSELLGYVAKMLLWKDPFSDAGFKMSVVLLTFAPAFYSAGIYYTLKHICLTFGAGFSRLRPGLYTWVFISCDVFSIVLQAAGGATASASEDEKVLKIGDNIMIAGLATQVATMLAFGLFAADYCFAIYRNRAHLNPATATLRRQMKFKLFCAALWLAYSVILIRCAYRLAELAKGWGPQNDILRNQRLFVGLDSVMCAIASVVLNVWHPGWSFPEEERDVVMAEKRVAGESSDEEEMVGV
ncbi:Efflux pump himE [Fulvia fulva]|uniref:Efflux pump himE n=1 Tax=Passalora fulva TaxID=5499 RepID=A0A9Q8LDL7_PASFU|nr:Efflux pump himE [Fulvia fulva]KAK4629469.1 Efflux pump himE [Fulvia fulva]KAK4629970.1 Efflux pump himE [Fulvia fulva]UJO15447.1 Efflux pump himE [Fulvia fulva]WPV12208.1 Efflux pump himE [Fulvia fulva]WPV27114.1 Efflux pump himE [Fulvia fulva]